MFRLPSTQYHLLRSAPRRLFSSPSTTGIPHHLFNMGSSTTSSTHTTNATPAVLADHLANDVLLCSLPTTLTTSLKQAADNSKAANLPPIAISPQQGHSLAIQCRLTSATNILEIGTLGGYSTLWLASSSPAAKVTTIELDPLHARVARENFARAGPDTEKQIALIEGDALDVLPRLLAEVEGGKREKFDFVLLDAFWKNQWEFFDLAVRLTRKGGGVYVDNAVRSSAFNGELEREGKGEKGEWKEGLIKKIGADGRVLCSLTSTVLTKRMGEGEGAEVDGFLQAVVL